MPSTLCFSHCTAKGPPNCALNDSKQGETDRTFPVSDAGEGSDITLIGTISKDGQNIFTKLWELLCRGYKLWKSPHEDHALEKLSNSHVKEPTWPKIGSSQAAHHRLLGHRGTRTGKSEDTNTCLENQRSGMYLDWYHWKNEQSELYPKSLPFKRRPDTTPVRTPLSVSCPQKPALLRKNSSPRARHSVTARNLRFSQSLACVDTEIPEHLSHHPRKLEGGVDLKVSRKVKPQATDMNSTNAKGKAH